MFSIELVQASDRRSFVGSLRRPRASMFSLRRQLACKDADWFIRAPYKEERFISGCLENLRLQGVQTYLIDTKAATLIAIFLRSSGKERNNGAPPQIICAT